MIIEKSPNDKLQNYRKFPRDEDSSISPSLNLPLTESSCQLCKQIIQGWSEEIIESHDLNHSLKPETNGKIQWINHQPNSFANDLQSNQEARRISRLLSQQNVASANVAQNQVKRAASVDDLYLQCVYKIEKIQLLLDQNSEQKLSKKKGFIQIATQNPAPEKETVNVLVILLTSVTWVMDILLTCIFKGLTVVKYMADQWMLVCCTFWSNLYQRKQKLMYTLMLIIPIVLLSGLVYGLLGMLLVINGLLLICGVLK